MLIAFAFGTLRTRFGGLGGLALVALMLPLPFFGTKLRVGALRASTAASYDRRSSGLPCNVVRMEEVPFFAAGAFCWLPLRYSARSAVGVFALGRELTRTRLGPVGDVGARWLSWKVDCAWSAPAGPVNGVCMYAFQKSRSSRVSASRAKPGVGSDAENVLLRSRCGFGGMGVAFGSCGGKFIATLEKKGAPS